MGVIGCVIGFMINADTIHITPDVLSLISRIDEFKRLLSNLQIKKFTSSDEQEVAGYAEVMELVILSWQDITFTENQIKQLHQNLLVYSEKDAWHRGNYKTTSNSVAAFDENGTQLGIVLSGTASNSRDDSYRCAELATLADILPAFADRAG